MKRLKVYMNDKFTGYTSFGINYLHESVDKMIKGNVIVIDKNKSLGHINKGENFAGGYTFYTDLGNKIVYILEA